MQCFRITQSSCLTLWCLRLLPIPLLIIILAAYNCSYGVLGRYGIVSQSWNTTKMECNGKWESLNFKINKTTKLFLKLEDFFWRKYVSQQPLPYGIKGSELMLLKVLSATKSYDMPAHIESLECRTCVVVGNGFAIKNTSLGRVINNYDVVIRLNDAPVRGYEEDVGNKTTLRIFYPESASSNPRLHNEEDTLMVLVPFKPDDLRWLKEILYDEKRVRKGFWKPPPLIWLGQSSKVRVLDPYFMQQTANKLLQFSLAPKKGQNHFHPTTGLLAVFVALNYCDMVHIAGFGYPPKSDKQQPIHYYGYHTMKSMKNSPHDVSREGRALKRLEDSGAVMYLHPHL
uniref:CMP-N-acetylneuraminate-beta-galactosamide-alpha-2,3-sialyltransferase 4 n=1 Tax=Oryzias latipes TaxID=8090 RepID=A0A3P9I2W1_ORYLA